MTKNENRAMCWVVVSGDGILVTDDDFPNAVLICATAEVAKTQPPCMVAKLATYPKNSLTNGSRPFTLLGCALPGESSMRLVSPVPNEKWPGLS